MRTLSHSFLYTHPHTWTQRHAESKSDNNRSARAQSPRTHTHALYIRTGSFFLCVGKCEIFSGSKYASALFFPAQPCPSIQISNFRFFVDRLAISLPLAFPLSLSPALTLSLSLMRASVSRFYLSLTFFSRLLRLVASLARANSIARCVSTRAGESEGRREGESRRRAPLDHISLCPDKADMPDIRTRPRSRAVYGQCITYVPMERAGERERET